MAAFIEQQARWKQALIIFVTACSLSQPRAERSVWMLPRTSQFWEYYVLTKFSARQWSENFCMTKDTFMYICNELRPRLTKENTRMRAAITVEKRVAVALWRLATTSEYRNIGHLFGISRSSVCLIVLEVCQLIMDILMPKHIKKPEGNQLKEIVEVFERKWGFPQCVGAVDGSHIPIIAPPEYHTDYFNRKGWHSVILQGVVDPCYRFWDINVGWQGSVHDAGVFRNTDLYKYGDNGRLFPNWKVQYHNVDVPLSVIGDHAYPLLEWVMKPYSDTGRLTRQQLNFNYHLSRARNVVENAYGRLKARWRCLLKWNGSSLQNVCVQIAACCTLHNICESFGEHFQEDWLQHLQGPALPQPVAIAMPKAVRQQVERIRLGLTTYFADQVV